MSLKSKINTLIQEQEIAEFVEDVEKINDTLKKCFDVGVEFDIMLVFEDGIPQLSCEIIKR